MVNTRRLLQSMAVIAPSLFTDAQTSCGPEAQILFQSNAYAETIIPNDYPSTFQGGIVISSQNEWDDFVESFQPNVDDEDLARTTINFSSEKVVIGTYYASSSCSVRLDDTRLECTSSDIDDVAVSMEVFLDVNDSSRDCLIKCEALGQVVYAVAVPAAWEVDETLGFNIMVTGGCNSEEESYTSATTMPPPKDTLRLSDCPVGQCLDPNGECQGEFQCFVNPCEVQSTPCADGQTCHANYCGGCFDVCLSDVMTTSPTNNGMSTTDPIIITDNCLNNQCLDPDGNCTSEVQCFADPCDVAPADLCSDGEVCEASYCGGCHAICVPVDDLMSTTSTEPNIRIDTTSSPGINVHTDNPDQIECSPNECLDLNGRCDVMVSCFADPCMNSSCSDDEQCESNYCGGCNAVCVPANDFMSTSTSSTLFIPCDTSTLSAMTTDANIQVDTTTAASTNTPNPLSGRCKDTRVAYAGRAYSRFLVPNGRDGIHTLTITSAEDMKNFESSFEPLSSVNDQPGFDGIDFSTEQVVFVTYYASSTCSLKMEYEYECSNTFTSDSATTSLQVSMAVVDESIGCEIVCEATGQMVLAIVTSVGMDVLYNNTVTGPCLSAREEPITPDDVQFVTTNSPATAGELAATTTEVPRKASEANTATTTVGVTTATEVNTATTASPENESTTTPSSIVKATAIPSSVVKTTTIPSSVVKTTTIPPEEKSTTTPSKVNTTTTTTTPSFRGTTTTSPLAESNATLSGLNQDPQENSSSYESPRRFILFSAFILIIAH